MRIASAGLAFSLMVGATSETTAQTSLGPYTENPTANPFPPPYQIVVPRPTLVDIDNDGDLDAFVGDNTGYVHFFRNNGGPDAVRRFSQETGSNNPVGDIDKGTYITPAFADVDGDGDFDLLVGNHDGSTYFFRNTGTAANPIFTEQTGANNPFDGITGATGKYTSVPANPVFADIDGDMDPDLFIGSSETFYGHVVKFFRNDGGVFTEQVGSANPFSNVNYSYNVTVAFADLDNDGDLDAIIGTEGNTRTWLQDDGTFISTYSGYGLWDPETGSGNVMRAISYAGNSITTFGDLDGDGDLDAISGYGYNGQSVTRAYPILYFENANGAFLMERRTGLNAGPFAGVDVREEASPTFVDIDNDGDLDLVLGSKYNSDPNRIQVLINEDGVFVTDPEHPLSNLERFLLDTNPVFVDIDNDGDLDLFLTNDYTIPFFRNEGGEFIEEESPLGFGYGLYSGRELSLAMFDFDNDGDYDAFVGNSNYSLGNQVVQYFENQGTPEDPSFVKVTPPEPFGTVNFYGNPNITAADVDNDGDFDIVVAETYVSKYYFSRFVLYENNGDGTFSETTQNVLNLPAEGIPSYSTVAFADLDEDGDLDAFVGTGRDYFRPGYDGTSGGRIRFFENQNPPPVTNINISNLTIRKGEPIVLDATLTITDPDNDDITRAVITISDFIPGLEILTHAEPPAGIVAMFDDETGVLEFLGRGTIAQYQSLLRSVTLTYLGESQAGRTKAVFNQVVTFQVRDVDFTTTTVSEVILAVDDASEIIVYNAVSPNGDGANDFLRISGIPSAGTTVSIYNRWGDEVASINDYNNNLSENRFEGKNKNNKDLPVGVYFYKVEIAGGKTITGYLSLKK